MTCAAGFSWKATLATIHTAHTSIRPSRLFSLHRPFTSQEDPSQRDHHQDIERRESERAQVDSLTPAVIKHPPQTRRMEPTASGPRAYEAG